MKRSKLSVVAKSLISSSKASLSLMATASLCLMSCSKEAPDFHSIVREAAENHYQNLIEGRYQDFADGMLATDLGAGLSANDSLPEAYRRELADAAAQFAVNETQKHGGIKAVQAQADSILPDTSAAYVNLLLTFGDNTCEEIQITLVRCQDDWKMK